MWMFFSWAAVLNPIQIPLRGVISAPALLHIYLFRALDIDEVLYPFASSLFSATILARYLVYIIALFHVKQKKKISKNVLKLSVKK